MRFRIWVQAVRPFAFSASLMPVALAAGLAFFQGADIAWPLVCLAALCSVLMHAGTNVVSEYYDFKKGLDTAESFGANNVLVQGLLPERQLLIGGYLFFAAAFLLGLVIVAARGWQLLALGIIGILGGLFYSARPVGYKYFALGDIMVFLLMGPLMVAGAYFTAVGRWSPDAVYVSLPVGFLVTAILNANNLRDIRFDRQAGVKTMENILGLGFAKLEYIFLVCAAYISIVVMTVAGISPVLSLLTAVSLPQAIKNIGCAWRYTGNEPRRIARLDQETAKLHLAFSVLLLASFFLAKLMPCMVR